MKFGKYLEERKAELPPEYAAHSIDYTQLKTLLKTTVYQHSIRADPPAHAALADVMSARLASLQDSETGFLNALEADIQRASNFFDQESQRLASLLKDDSQPLPLLQRILTLERFVFLNYTGITKILKKNDRHSGLSVSEPCLRRVATLPLVRAEDLSKLKQTVMERLSQQQQVQPHDLLLAPASPAMLRSRSQQKLMPSSVLPPTLVGPNQKVLVSMAGPHGTDIIGAVLECLARHPCDINDCMLSRLYHNVTFGVLITLRSDNVAIFRDLADAAQKWDAALTFDVPDTQALEPSVRHHQQSPEQAKSKPANEEVSEIYLPPSLEEAPYSGRIKYAASILNQNGIQPAFLNGWTQLCLKYRISVEKLSRLNKDGTILSCADFRLSIPNTVDMNKLRTDLFELSAENLTDIALQPDDVFRKNKRLVVFDMDSTLIQQEVIDEIARYAGVVDQVAVSTRFRVAERISYLTRFSLRPLPRPP